MRKKKIIFLAVFVILVFVISVPVYSFSANYLDFLCKRAKGGLIAVMCDLRDRVIALENRDPVPGPTGPQGPQGPKGDPGPLVFPEPEFVSEWIDIPPRTAVIDITHNLGGNIEDYFIDLQVKRPPENGTMTSHQTAADKIWWEDVTPTGIQIATNGDVTNIFDKVRVRIWVVGK